jgi:hypothetical protein
MRNYRFATVQLASATLAIGALAADFAFSRSLPPQLNGLKATESAQAASSSSRFRFDGRIEIAQDANRSTTTPSSLFVVDGLALGDKIRFESETYKQYHCKRSEYVGLRWCNKRTTEKTYRGQITKSTSILHNVDGTIVYINRYIEPAFFPSNDVDNEIDRLSARFRSRPREFRLQRDGMPNALIAIWGKVDLLKLDAGNVSTIASGGQPHKGMLIGFLGDLQQSAKIDGTIYQIAGGAGYVWAPTFDANRRGVLRFLAIDTSSILLPGIQQATPPSSTEHPRADPTGNKEGFSDVLPFSSPMSPP